MTIQPTQKATFFGLGFIRPKTVFTGLKSPLSESMRLLLLVASIALSSSRANSISLIALRLHRHSRTSTFSLSFLEAFSPQEIDRNAEGGKAITPRRKSVKSQEISRVTSRDQRVLGSKSVVIAPTGAQNIVLNRIHCEHIRELCLHGRSLSFLFLLSCSMLFR